MSFIIRATRTSTVRCFATPMQTRCIAVSSPRLLKETIHDPEQGEVYERAKQEQLRKQKEGKNEWDPRVASQSEENVHADREANKDFKEMQREAKERAENEFKTGSRNE